MRPFAMFVAAATCLAACGARQGTILPRSPEGGTSGDSETETLRGRVAIIGTAPRMQTVIRPEGGGADVVAESAVADSLRSVDGLVVSVQGQRERLAFVVKSFTVLSVDGSPVHDGILAKTTTGYVLHARDDRTTLLPSSIVGLELLVGYRIWIVAGPEAGGGRFGHIR